MYFISPKVTFVVISVNPHINDSKYTIYVDIYYTIMPVLLQLTSWPTRLETYRRHYVQLNCSRRAFAWFYIVIYVRTFLVCTYFHFGF